MSFSQGEQSARTNPGVTLRGQKGVSFSIGSDEGTHSSLWTYVGAVLATARVEPRGDGASVGAAESANARKLVTAARRARGVVLNVGLGSGSVLRRRGPGVRLGRRLGGRGRLVREALVVLAVVALVAV